MSKTTRVGVMNIHTGKHLDIHRQLRDLTFVEVEKKDQFFILSYDIDAFLYYDAERDIFKKVSFREFAPELKETYERWLYPLCSINGDTIYYITEDHREDGILMVTRVLIK